MAKYYGFDETENWPPDSVLPEKMPNYLWKLPKNDISHKLKDFDYFTKIA